jgi:hypothetical protein
MRFVLAEFSAPWSRSLRLTTAASVAILLAVMLAGLLTGPRHLLIWRVVMVGVPPVLLFSALPFMVRGYVLTEKSYRGAAVGVEHRAPTRGACRGDRRAGWASRLATLVWERWTVWD